MLGIIARWGHNVLLIAMGLMTLSLIHILYGAGNVMSEVAV